MFSNSSGACFGHHLPISPKIAFPVIGCPADSVSSPGSYSPVSKGVPSPKISAYPRASISKASLGDFILAQKTPSQLLGTKIVQNIYRNNWSHRRMIKCANTRRCLWQSNAEAQKQAKKEWRDSGNGTPYQPASTAPR